MKRLVVVGNGQARLTELTELLPLPLPPHPPLRASLYTAPELVLTPPPQSARVSVVVNPRVDPSKLAAASAAPKPSPAPRQAAADSEQEVA